MAQWFLQINQEITLLLQLLLMQSHHILLTDLVPVMDGVEVEVVVLAEDLDVAGEEEAMDGEQDLGTALGQECQIEGTGLRDSLAGGELFFPTFWRIENATRDEKKPSEA